MTTTTLPSTKGLSLRPVEGPVEGPMPSYSPTRADIVREATKRVPLNNFNLPEGFHRSDLLHPHSGVLKKVVPQEDLLKLPSGIDVGGGLFTDDGPLLVLDEKLVRQAYVPLDYREGFPTIPDSGLPFWGQLSFEPAEAFKAFLLYLDQGKEEGARRLFALACQPKVHTLCLGYAQPTKESNPYLTEKAVKDLETDESRFERERDLSSRSNRQLQEWFTLYYWGSRARAHDIFYLDGIRQSQGMKALHLQNDHFRDAQELYHKVMSFINGDSPEYQTTEGVPRFWAEMTPRVLVDFMKVLTAQQRISLGLPGNVPATADSPSSAVGILQSLISGAASGPSPGSSSGRGRPRIAYDEMNRPISSAALPSSVQTPTSSLGSDNGMGISDEDRVRRIGMIMNSAKARRDANQSKPDSKDV